MSLDFYSESSETEIPNAPGLYAFYLDMLSPAKIGLGGRGPFMKEQLADARERLIVRVKRRQALIQQRRLFGELTEDKPGGHLRRVYSIEAEVCTDLEYVDASTVPLSEIREFASVLSRCMIFDKPIYVGITNDQSLRQRYTQHKSDFYSELQSGATFGSRFQNAGGDWDDLKFGCVQLDSTVFGTKSVGRLEKLIQSLTRPTYSMR
jgi:hypothetical protein